jgi:hypothetical protein
MSKFKIGDRVKFHMEECPEYDDTGTVCEGPHEVTDAYCWINWDKGGDIQYSAECYLTMIESPAKEELPSSFKIDVQAYADENNISLEQAHNEIQPWLFENGFVWENRKSLPQKEVMYEHATYLFCSSGVITFWSVTDYFEVRSTQKQIFLSRNVSVSLSGKEEETVEILGKKYRKSDVENAMKNVKEKE